MHDCMIDKLKLFKSVSFFLVPSENKTLNYRDIRFVPPSYPLMLVRHIESILHRVVVYPKLILQDDPSSPPP